MFNLSIMGATGLVGTTLLRILEEENFPVKNLNLYASEKSQNKTVKFKNDYIKVEKLDENYKKDADFYFFMTEKEISKKYISNFKGKGVVIDNSSAFRLKNGIPLIVPEINFNQIENKKIIANPNCTTAICAIPLHLLNKNYGICRVNVSTYQAVSGCGNRGINALNDLSDAQALFNCNIKETCLPFIGNLNKNGYTSEELKLDFELKKILNLEKIKISATCVRVPIRNCHGATVSVTLKKKFSLQQIYDIFAKNNNICLLEDEQRIPNGIVADNSNKVYVGRIRRDNSLNNSLLFYVVSDNLRRGAAYNAYEIMKYCIENDCM